MGVKERIKRLENIINPPPQSDVRTDIKVNVTSPDEPDRPRDPEGLPTLTPEETADVRAGTTLCFIYTAPPRSVSFKRDGRGEILTSTRG